MPTIDAGNKNFSKVYALRYRTSGFPGISEKVTFTAYIYRVWGGWGFYYPQPPHTPHGYYMAQDSWELAQPLVDLKKPPKKKTKRGPCRRHWFFTDNGVAGKKGKELIGEAWKELPEGVSYLSWQLEAGKKTKHPHLQGHIELKRDQYVSWLHKSISKTARFLVRRGTAEQCDAYCHKEKGRLEGPFTLGVASKGPGSRTDLEALREAIKEGAPTRILAEDHLICLAKYPRLVATLKTLYRPRWDPAGERVHVYLFYGKTGTGKTLSVYKRWANKNSFYEMPIATMGTWWDGFDGHDRVLMDDFSGSSSHMRLDTLLKILDSYPRRVPVKGSFAWYKVKYVAITTNIHPRKWYDYSDREEQYNALHRRIKKVILFDDTTKKMYIAPDSFWEVEDREDLNDGDCCHNCNYCNIPEHKTKKRKRVY